MSIDELIKIKDYLKIWKDLLNKAKQIEKEYPCCRVVVGHIEYINDETNERITNLPIYGVYIQAYSLANAVLQTQFFTITNAKNTFRYLDALEIGFKKNGVITINDGLLLELMDMDGDNIPIDAVIEYIGDDLPDKTNNNDLKPVNEVFPNEPTDEEINKYRRIYLTDNEEIISNIGSSKSSIKIVTDFNNALNQELKKNNRTEHSGLKKYINKCLNKDKELTR